MHIQKLILAFETFAPTYLANDWDNVGLLVGSKTWSADNILLTIDLTEAVMQEAIGMKADTIVSYHPPIFHPLKSITGDSFKERVVLDAITNHIAIYSPHTSLDVATGGVNDWIVSCFGSGDVRALRPFGNLPPNEECKLVTYCPEDQIEELRLSLSSVGCGRIGLYEQCSFSAKGTGTFLGKEGTNPTQGEAGELQQVIECKFEMVVSKSSLSLAIQTLRQFHPYEEPALEVHELGERPRREMGVGRRVHLDQPMQLDALARKLKKHLGIGYVRVAPAAGKDDRAKVQTIGLCAGAGGSVCNLAIDDGCEVFITGEMTHHDVVAATARGCTVVLTGHTNSERGYLPKLKEQLSTLLPEANISVSTADAPLWTYY
ncbi:MAG: Nif3-like dinuclear metal center hexameric protein [Phycisphaerales bacterium]|jgi:dinuclear metal center YbgI/SA1388 family protein|nr:Nif3-like dinuclear metal center hexameric protein [Phycisphaerales bacterium]